MEPLWQRIPIAYALLGGHVAVFRGSCDTEEERRGFDQRPLAISVIHWAVKACTGFAFPTACVAPCLGSQCGARQMSACRSLSLSN